MSVKRIKGTTHDRSRVAVETECEVQYWMEKLGVSREVLRDAVQAVGNSPDRVFEYVRNRARRNPTAPR